jgi:simple sugar transport system permease protein
MALAVMMGALGVAATQSSVSNLESVFVWSALIASMLRYATPLIFAAIGGMFSERSGVVNIGLEGMLLVGAFFGFLGADKLDSWVWGIVTAAVAGGLLALIHAVVSIHLRADQILSGTAIWFLALGLTGYLFVDIYGPEGTPGGVSTIPSVDLGFLDGIPILEGFSNLNLLIWVGLLLVPLSYYAIFRTAFGLRLRSVGEHPRAAETVGLSVYRIRYTAVVLSGVLAGLGGAFVSIGFVNSFSENMIAGQGFIALAALIFGNWRPGGLFAAALLFGFSSAIAQRLPVYSDSLAVLFQSLPYLLTLIAVAGVIRRPRPPAAVGIPYVRS